MTVLNYAKNQVALLVAGSTTTAPTYLIIGTGSATIVAGDTELTTANDRQAVTATTHPSLVKTKWQGDWNSVEMSGIQLTEWGMIGSADLLTGSIWSKEVIPSLTFDGTNELRIEETWEVF